MRSARQLLPTFPFLRSSDNAPLFHLPSGHDNDWLKALNDSATWGIRDGVLNLRGVEVMAFAGIGPGIDSPDPHLTAETLVVTSEAPYDDGSPKKIHNTIDADGTVLSRSVLMESAENTLPLPLSRKLRSDTGTMSGSGSTHAQLVAAHLYGEEGLVKFITGTPAVAPTTATNTNAVKEEPADGSVGPSMLDLTMEGPAVALVEQVNAPGVATGVTPALLPVIDLPESDLSVAGGQTHVSVGHPYLPDGSGSALRVRLTTTGSGDYTLSIALLVGDEVTKEDFRLHTSHADRLLTLTWNQANQSFTVDVGANPPALVTAVPYGGATLVGWSSVPGATGYRVFRRRDSFPSFELVATVAADVLSWLAVSDPWSGTSEVPPAQFTVSAIVGAEESAFSVTVTNNDQDGDGLSDVEEAVRGTDPTLVDTDSDGLGDWQEVQIGTNPLNMDSDGDDVSDGDEYRVGSDPLRPDITTGPTPEIVALSPSSTVAGQGLTLTIDGAGFFAGVSVVQVAGQPVPTTFRNSGQLQATVSQAALCPPGPCSVTVLNPPPGGGVSNSSSLEVTKATPLITWANPSSIAYGTALSATQLNAIASVPGAFEYTPPVGTLLPVGQGQVLSTTFTPNDGVNYTIATKTVTIDVTGTAPAVTLHPSDYSVPAGSIVSFSAAASGNPAPTLTWQVRNSSESQAWNDINGATGTTYTFTTTAEDHNKQYRVFFINVVGSAATNPATLTVQTAPTVSAHPSNLTVNAGSTATFTAAANGRPTPTIQWQVNSSGSAWSDIEGATGTIYAFTVTGRRSQPPISRCLHQCREHSHDKRRDADSSDRALDHKAPIEPHPRARLHGDLHGHGDRESHAYGPVASQHYRRGYIHRPAGRD